MKNFWGHQGNAGMSRGQEQCSRKMTAHIWDLTSGISVLPPRAVQHLGPQDPGTTVSITVSQKNKTLPGTQPSPSLARVIIPSYHKCSLLPHRVLQTHERIENVPFLAPSPSPHFFQALQFHHIGFTRREPEWVFGEPILNVCHIHKGFCKKSQPSRWRQQTGPASHTYNRAVEKAPHWLSRHPSKSSMLGRCKQLEKRKWISSFGSKIVHFCELKTFCFYKLSTNVFAHF